MENRDFINRDAGLPNFCRLGVFLRVVIAVESVLAFAAAAASELDGWGGFFRRFVEWSVFAQPLLALILLVFCVANSRLAGLSQRAGRAAASALAAGLAGAGALFFNRVFPELPPWSPARVGLFSGGMTLCLLAYFRLRDLALSPALAEARLQALQSRIRPHFLFNTLNAVLSLIRSDPRRAETALEDLSELFRALVSDARRLVPLVEEVKLTRRYLEIEQLRLGERLKVAWRIDKMPGDALVPPLLLQPLVENAVYHGIEPATEPGEIQLDLYSSRDQVHIVVRNPAATGAVGHAGNHMALDNIRERLLLYFDLDASLTCEQRGGTYQVHLVLPYSRHAAHPDR